MKPADLGHVLFLAGVLLALGCAAQPPAAEPAPSADIIKLGSQFDPTRCGVIVGQVVWDGPRPEVPKIEKRMQPLDQFPFRRDYIKDNPAAPFIDEATRGMRDVVVFLRGIDPARSRPWDHAAVHIEMIDTDLRIQQGNTPTRAGFVRRGTTVTAVSRDAVPHALRFNGPTLFTLPFPDPDQPLERTLAVGGPFELESGMGFFWMRGFLFVDDHPYYARTDAQGRFELRDVPAGAYELVCWHPSWYTGSSDRNPESGQPHRLRFGPPLEKSRKIIVEPGQQVVVDYMLSTKLFPPARD